jgi:hypothetical protein
MRIEEKKNDSRDGSGANEQRIEAHTRGTENKSGKEKTRKYTETDTP